MAQTKYVTGKYDEEENILWLSHPKPITLNTPTVMEEFFREVTYWIQSCPTKPYLLVDYNNLEIAVDITWEYAQQLRNYRPLVLSVYRYGLSTNLSGSFTAMAVRMGNLKSSTSSNIYQDEATARQAIQEARESATKQAKRD